MKLSVNLVKERKQLKSGRAEYWVLRWRSPDGRHCSKSLGRVGDVSNRAARKAKRLMENEFSDNPGLRGARRGMTARQLVTWFTETQTHELAVRSVGVYKIACDYLLAYFGENRAVDMITRADAAAFKSALAGGKIRPFEKKTNCNAVSVNLYLGTLRALFNRAIRVDLLAMNPFDRSVGRVKQAKDWHYLSMDEYAKIQAVATPQIKVLVALCRLAGLRRAEALNLHWENIDWENGRLLITGKDDWQPKDRERRTIPMCPELQAVLLEAHERAPEGAQAVIRQIYKPNATRYVRETVRRSGVAVYSKPLHTLRKSCLTDWSGRFPMHCVMEWAGHANVTTTQQFYLKVSAADYELAATQNFWGSTLFSEKCTENCTENGKRPESGVPKVGN